MHSIHYQFSFNTPQHHLAAVKLTLTNLNDSHVDLFLPTWCAGSYMIRDYAQHLVVSEACDEHGKIRTVSKVDKTTWRVEAEGASTIIFKYQVYCHMAGQIIPRRSHIVDDFAFLYFPTLAVCPVGRNHEPVSLTVTPPDGWKTYTGLSPLGQHGVEGAVSFEAPTYDYFLDTPVLSGKLHCYPFEVDGVPHYYVSNESLPFVGIPVEPFLADIADLVRGNRVVFDHYPYKQYYFFLLAVEQGGGGLEHHNSSVNVFPLNELSFPDEERPYSTDNYISLLSLLSHENFHAWNVKEFGPAALCCPDYTVEADTGDIWTVEGFAKYFEKRALLRAHLIDSSEYLKLLSKDINRLDRTPGRKNDSVVEAGVNAWIRFYRAHENNVNTTVSYYLKGGLLCTLLDIEMRLATDGAQSLDALVDYLSHHYPYQKPDKDGHAGGYPRGHIKDVAEKLTGKSFDDFFDKYVEGTEELPVDESLARIGIEVQREQTHDYSLGMSLNRKGSKVIVNEVLMGYFAWRAGISPGDLVVALDGRRVRKDNFESIVENLYRGKREQIDIHLFRNGRLRAISLPLRELDEISPVSTLLIDKNADPSVARIRDQWLAIDEA